ALYRLQQQNIDIACLVTTVWKKDQQTVAHGENRERVKKQAQSLGIPVYFIETDFDMYGEDFVEALVKIKNQYTIDGAAFGDIYLKGHRDWGEAISRQAGLEAVYPLWTEQENALALLQEFVELNFKARIIKIDHEKLPKSWIGRLIDGAFIDDIKNRSVCPMGESGEYHTFVYDGPVFAYPLQDVEGIHNHKYAYKGSVLMMRVIDSHIHVDLYAAGERMQMLSELATYRVEALISVSSNLASSKKNLQLAQQDRRIKSAFGFHAAQIITPANEIADLQQWIDQNAEEMVAIGEVGLPYYLRKDDPTIQLGAYIEILELFIHQARHLNKPIVLHAIYEDAPRVLDLLEAYSVKQ